MTTYEKNLRGFAHVTLAPQEKRTVTFILKPADFALWNRDMKFVIELGTFRVMMGSLSEDIRWKAEFEITLPRVISSKSPFFPVQSVTLFPANHH